MKFIFRLLALLFCLQISVSFADTQTQDIRRVVNELRKAILTKNTTEFLKHVSKTNGLTCTDDAYTHKEVKKFLSNRDSELYISLFDTAKYSKQCGDGYPKEYPAIAEIDFLHSANESIEIMQVGNDWVEITIESPIKTHYPRLWYMHREAQTWKVSGGSFIIGNCTCGG